MPVGARRTQSLPSKYMIPSASMGEYESGAGRRKSAPAKPPSGGLFPLDEEGTYGRPPAPPAPPPPATPKRERKTKVYSSYSVDSKCDLHAKKLAKVEKQRERELEEQRSRRRRSIAANRRNVSASPSRASSEARTSRSSKSPDPGQPPNGYMRRKSSGASDVSARKSSTGYSSNGVSSSTNFQSSTRYSSSSSSYKISNIREENEEYTYQENRRKHSGYSKYANDDGGLSNGMSGMSLDGLRKPNIDSWDSMGILGLSSKMWNDTSSKKQGYMSSMREENYNSYIM